MAGMDGFINFNGTLEGSIAGGSGGNVTDVKVRNSQQFSFESVVNEEGVAEVDLISYVRRNELIQSIQTVVDNVELLLDNKQNVVNYSTEEQNTGIKWINGLPLYQKTITINNANEFDIEIANSNEAIITSGFWNIGSTYLSHNEYIGGQYYAYMHIDYSNGKAMLHGHLNGFNAISACCNVIYTKTEV